MPPTEVLAEAARQFEICNACRYCEGYCAVFPAMERRVNFASADLHYLANLCHNCGECYHACQYAPSHDFAIDLPRALAALRQKSWREFAWPRPLAAWLAGDSAAASLLLIALLLLPMLALSLVQGALPADAGGDFYRVVSHTVMAGGFGMVALFVLFAWGVSAHRFWRTSRSPAEPVRLADAWQALRDALALRYLHAAGADCPYPDERASGARRWFHHATFYGFLACFAATSVATLYHYGFDRPAPYSYSSLPVLLGTLGGIGLIIGPAGLWWLKRRAPAAGTEASHREPGNGFILLLLLTSITGLLLLALRETAVMGWLLLLHLAIVLALFLTLPYGRFAHALYRCLALLRYAQEGHAVQTPGGASSGDGRGR